MGRTKEMIKMSKEGRTIREIADAFDISYQRVWAILHKEGFDMRANGQRIAVNRKHDAIAKSLVETYRYGEKSVDVARRHGISIFLLWQIKKTYGIKTNMYQKNDKERYCSVCGEVDAIDNFRYDHGWHHKPCYNAYQRKRRANGIRRNTSEADKEGTDTGRTGKDSRCVSK